MLNYIVSSRDKFYYAKLSHGNKSFYVMRIRTPDLALHEMFHYYQYYYDRLYHAKLQ